MNTAADALCIGGLIGASQGGVADSSSGRLIGSLWLGNEISLLSRAQYEYSQKKVAITVQCTG